MNNRVLVALLGLWCVLVVVPGFITTVGMGISGTDTAIGGATVGVWIVGYLVQFAVWWVIASKSHSNAMLGWFVASGMPFVADWISPVSAWLLILCFAVTAAYAAWFYRGEVRSQQLQAHGIVATGTVIEVVTPMMNEVINDVYIKRTLRLRVQRNDGAPAYEAKFKGTFMIGSIPAVGDRLRLRVDPNDPQHIESDSSSGSTSSGTASSSSSSWTASNRTQSFTTAPPPAPSHPGGGGITDDLGRLAAMHERGELTDAEYTRAKNRLLGS